MNKKNLILIFFGVLIILFISFFSYIIYNIETLKGLESCEECQERTGKICQYKEPFRFNITFEEDKKINLNELFIKNDTNGI